MATHRTNTAVSEFREIMLAEFDLEHRRQELTHLVAQLTREEFDDYALMTISIEEAETQAQQQIENNPRWAWSTKRNLFRNRVSSAGMDKTGVPQVFPCHGAEVGHR